MVISASWLSRKGDGDSALNLRGISTVLALAAFLRRKSSYSINDLPFSILFGLQITHIGPKTSFLSLVMGILMVCKPGWVRIMVRSNIVS